MKMKTVGILNYRSLLMSVVLLLGAGLAVSVALAEEGGHDQTALIKALPQSKHSLMDGLRQATRTPEVEVFKDVPHVARSSQQLTLMSLSRFTLADIVAKAQKEHQGTVFSIAPTVRNHKPVFVVLAAVKGKAVELDYNVSDGMLIPSRR